MSNLSQDIADLSPKQLAILESRLRKKRRSVSQVQISRRNNDLAPAPLSFAQQRLWFLDQLHPGSSAYNLHGAIPFGRRSLFSAIETSLGEIIRRHEVLRTSFPAREGQPVQTVAPNSAFKLRVIDLRHVAEGKRREEAKRLAAEEAQRGFDLAHGPLLRTTLLQLGEQSQLLLVTMHHVISDEWAVELFKEELAVLCEAFFAGAPSPFEELPIQYADFAVWQREWLQGEVLDKQLAYWRKKLDGMPTVLELPSDRPRPQGLSFKGSIQQFSIPQVVAAELRELSRREGVTLFMTVLSAFKVLLHRYTGSPDIFVGTALANRNRAEVERLLGFFANTLIFRTDFSGDPSFRELLGMVRETTLEAYAHQDLPFEKLIDELHPDRSLSRAQQIQVGFVLHKTHYAPSQRRRTAPQAQSRQHSGMSKFDLTLSMADGDEGLTGHFEFNTDMFESETISRMINHFQILLESVAAGPDQRVSRLPILTGRERHQLLVEWNKTAEEFSGRESIHELIEEQVKRVPDRVAVAYEGEQITLRELNRKANQLAHYLSAAGVGLEVPVGIYMERCPEMVVGMLGVLKAGGAYMPLDPEHPTTRLAGVLEEAGVKVVLTRDHLRGRLKELSVREVCVDTDWEEIETNTDEDPGFETSRDQLAYVLYTSGSTGRPKGTLVTQGGLVNYLKWCVEAYGIADGGVAPVHTPVTFDLTVTSLFVPLIVGGRLELLREEYGIEALRKAMQEGEKYSFVKLTPAHLGMLNEQMSEECSRSRMLIIGGEALTAEKLEKWRGGGAKTRLINEYGPTETVVGCCVYEVREQDGDSGAVPIGRPIANTEMYVLDKGLEPVAVAVKGEIYIGGEGVARGYVNRAELTAERFIPDGHGRNGERVYRSGDVGRYRADGNIEYLGRTDEQVKIRGYRVEPGEIEAALLEVGGIRQALVMAREDEEGTKRLVGYVVEEEKGAGSVTRLRSELEARLPEYLIPAAFVVMDSLPLTANGKVDRKALPHPEGGRADSQETFAAARDDIEMKLVSIWEEILGIRPVGIRDDFFDLGGDSFTTVRLMTSIRKQFGQRLDLSIIFEAQTIEHLADYLRRELDTTSRSPVVPIQPHGSKLPFFCVHPGSGFVFLYGALARHLGPDQPFYGLEDPYVYGKRDAYATLEERAAHYVEALRAVQPRGPYALGGYSFGGHVAFEMAQILRRQGEEVSLLAVMDTFAPIHSGKLAKHVNDSLLMSIIKKDVKAMVANRTDNGGNSSLNKKLGLGLDTTSQAVSDVEERVLRASVELFKSRIDAVQKYVPQTFDGRIILFRTSEVPTEFSDQLSELHQMRLEDPTHGWGQLSTQPVEIVETSGEHATILSDPHVQLLARELKLYLDGGRAGAAQPT